MKKFEVCLDMITVNKHGKVMEQNCLPVTVFADSRGEAITASLDVGQAISRSANCSCGDIAIFFRATTITELEEVII